MNFLKGRLQEVTEHQLEVTNVFEFLEKICLNLNSSQKSQLLRVTNFKAKWQFEKYVKGLNFAYIASSWAPSTVARTFELSDQKSWNQYVAQNYKLAVSSSTSTNCATQPFTFKEMIQGEFWMDMYNYFGSKITSFIFEKALVIFEVEEDFYLVISSNFGALNQKLLRSNATAPKRAGGGPAIRVTNSFNPYVIENAPQTNVIQSLEQPSISCPLKRKNEEEAMPDIQLKKKTKMLTNCSTNFECSNSVIPEIKKSQPGQTDINEDSLILRWLKPSNKILQFIVNERERLKQQSGGTFQPHQDVDDLVQLSFIGILTDAEFAKISRNNLYAIIKQFRILDFNNMRMPSQWKGLFIKEPEPHSANRKYNANVYLICEKFALKHSIRVKAKQRRLKKALVSGSHKMDMESTGVPDEVDIHKNTELQNAQGVPQHQNDQNFCVSSVPLFNINSGLIENFIPFNPLIMIEVLPALYNRSSWSRWPKNHIFTIASSNSSEEGANILVQDILDLEVGSSRMDKLIEKLKVSPEFSKLLNILKLSVVFHKRIKHFHKIVRHSIAYWIRKKQEKCFKLEKRKLERKEWRFSHPRRLGLKPTCLENKPVEVIDLTMNTETDTTFFELDNSRSLGDSMIFSASSGYHNSTELTHDTPVLTQRQLKKVEYLKLKEAIPHSCILMMLKHILHLSGLDEAFGSKKNVRSYSRFLRKSLSLAGTRSSLQLGQMMSEMDPTSCEWLSCVKSHNVKMSFLSKFSMWIFTNYIITILRSSFYITEVNASRSHTKFYLRESWKSISENVRSRLVSSGTLKHIGPIPYRPPLQKKCFDSTNSRLRLLPKNNHDLRPIISLRANQSWTEKDAKLIVDNTVRAKMPHRDRDTNFLRQRWSKFLKNWDGMGKPKLYYVKADIKDAYPSVNIKKLKTIINSLSSELHTVTKKDFKVIGRSRISLRTTVVDSNNLGVWYASICTRPCIIVQNHEGQGTQLKVSDVFHKCFPFKNQIVLRIGKQMYSFEQGLPQGGGLSEVYCNLYYGEMDIKNFSKFLTTPGEFFNTSVDDYLYVTPNPRKAARFLHKLENGFPKYNCVFNPDKILTNIFPRVGTIVPLQECEWVTCCGWRFCLTCGHIMRDFSLYAGQDMASTVTFILRNASTPENFLISRMKCMLPARLHFFLLDPAINCRERIIFNIWEAAMIFAFRFYAICRVIYPSLAFLKNPLRAKQSIYAIMVCTRALSRLVVRGFKATYSDQTLQSKCTLNKNEVCQCIHSYQGLIPRRQSDKPRKITTHVCRNVMPKNGQLLECEILWIIYHAFIVKLTKHSSVFGSEVLPRLYKIQHNISSSNPVNVESLTELLGLSMPFQFQNIKV